MSGDEKARVTAKIRALFSKTEGAGATVAEAAAAAAKANELITNYNLTLEDLEVRDQGSYVKVMVGFACPKKMVRTHQSFLHAIATGNFCKTVRWYGAKSALVGRTENVEFVVWLYDTLQAEINRLLKAQKPAWARSAWARQFWYGAMNEIRNRFYAQREQMEKAEAGAKVTALVLVTSEALDRAVYELIGETSKGRGSAGPKSYGSAYQLGQSAGRTVSLNRPLGGAASQKSLGA